MYNNRAMCVYADGTANGAEGKPVCNIPWRSHINNMGMREEEHSTHDLLIQTMQRWTKGSGRRDWRGSLPERSQWLRPRRTLRCTGDRTGRTGRRRAAGIKLQFRERDNMGRSSAALLPTRRLHERVEKRRPLTSLVLQMSPSVDPQAFPGVAFHGIIPEAMKVTGFHT